MQADASTLSLLSYSSIDIYGSGAVGSASAQSLAFHASEIRGFGRTGGKTEIYRGSAYQVDFVPKIRIDLVISDTQVQSILDALERSARTGKIGDGKVFVLNVEEALRIRTGERGEEAI